MIRSNFIWFLVFFGIESAAFCETPQINLKTSMSLYLTGTYIDLLLKSPYNPENSVLLIGSKSGSIDARPNLKLDGGPFQLIGRPQLKSTLSRTKVAGKESLEHATSSAHWLESYGVYTASDQLQVTYGVQNYQWGAAETLNPSNRIFHETLDQKLVTSAPQGRDIARLNYSWTKNLSSILMSEVSRQKDLEDFRAEETFQTKSLMKHEFNWNSGADYFGIVYGASEKGSPWVGEYLNISLFDGLTFYVDASHQKNSDAWYPVLESSKIQSTVQVVQLKQSKLDDSKTYSTAVGGLRYSFEGGSDLRFEYLLNQAGWSKFDSQNAVLALDSTNPYQRSDYKINLGRALKPGLEYRGQKYGLISLRVPDLFNVKDLVIYSRIMESFLDFSASAYGSIEYGFGASSTAIVSVIGSRGDVQTDLRGVISSSVTAGLRQDF